jgi:hypothetical protein
MNKSWKHWIAAACLVAACVPALAQKKDSIVIDGNDWISASVVERRAFLVGAGNMIVAENAYAKRRNVAAAPVSAEITRAVDKMTLADIEARITRWYEANPGKMSTPVLGVVWHQIVKTKP